MMGDHGGLHRVGFAVRAGQPFDRADQDMAVLHRQILSLQQGEPQIAGDPGMFEIGVVQRPRRQEADPAVGVAAQGVQRVAKVAKEPGQAVDLRNIDYAPR